MDADGLWVFGYGSLIWHPGFDFVDRRHAALRGFRRAFCMRSIAYRGTPEAPGLVLALDRDAAAVCAGVAYRVAAPAAEAVLAYLRARELVTDAYTEAWLPLALDDGGEVEAVAYVSNPEHAQYCSLPLEAQAEVIARAAGPNGPNADYLLRTVESLEALGLHDADLVDLADRVRGLIAASAGIASPRGQGLG